jgi:hypothetical protein
MQKILEDWAYISDPAVIDRTSTDLTDYRPRKNNYETTNLSAFSTLLLMMPICFTILGCEKSTATANNTEVTELSTKVGRLEIEMQGLKERMDDIEIIRATNRVAYLTTGESGYDSVQFSLGTPHDILSGR